MLDASPTWDRFDDLRSNFVSRIEIHDGRQTERDLTETSTATVYFNDRDGVFDGAALDDVAARPIAFSVWDPVDGVWVQQGRMTVHDVQRTLNPATKDGVSILSNVQLECVGVFEYLARAEMVPGIHGDLPLPPGVSAATIFYEDGDIQTRLTQLLTDAGLDPDMFVLFTGHVNCQERQYDIGDQFLPACREAADAEMPALANFLEDKLGRVCFRGRDAALDPDTVAAGASAGAWDFNRWKAGDGAAIVADPGNVAQIREFSYAYPLDRLVNQAICYPRNASRAAIPATQVKRDTGSIDRYGISPRSDTDLINDGDFTNGDTALEACARIADFWKTYYAQPFDRIERISFKTVRPNDARAVATWGVLTGASIGDIVNVNVGYPGGAGVQDDDELVQGRDMVITPLGTDEYDLIELSLNLSPFVEDTEGIFA